MTFPSISNSLHLPFNFPLFICIIHFIYFFICSFSSSYSSKIFLIPVHCFPSLNSPLNMGSPSSEYSIPFPSLLSLLYSPSYNNSPFKWYSFPFPFFIFVPFFTSPLYMYNSVLNISTYSLITFSLISFLIFYLIIFFRGLNLLEFFLMKNYLSYHFQIVHVLDYKVFLFLFLHYFFTFCLTFFLSNYFFTFLLTFFLLFV